ncbi:hypothetical protein PPYR_13397 [Photinus pyralis]|uniref:H/ACA ribonucleoprotein complex non-core subunit NAF1 n=2 Tax=Photinus pyralis TaxID=7054 RepID=A0A5N4A8Y8_PHOPY|nr:H/ACA ribonucleoprotein complex non-core subunit NAF1 [Photinus pyralis]KAB0793777.1 hypothetical protein PPYR_13397 [Photinus pyralis]
MDSSTGLATQKNGANAEEKATEVTSNEEQIAEPAVTINVAHQNDTNSQHMNSKTEPSVDESRIQNISNNDELCDNVKQLNLVEDEAASVPIRPSNISESLSNLLAYGSSSEDSEIDSASESDSDEKHEENYRDPKADTSDSSDNESSDSESEIAAKEVKQPSKPVTHIEGELGLKDLPPVPDLSTLNIDLKQTDCIQMGNVTSIVDSLVTIQSLPNVPAYDLDTLLFLDEGRQPLGYVHDVMGQVTSPMYVVRFNSKQEIESKGISKGLPVYSAPNTEHTQYVFLKELMKIKGSDASWKGDNEVPVEFVDFSDDETEYTFSKQHLNEKDIFDKKRKRNSFEKHRMFETAMNLKNKVDTARHKMRDSYEPTPKRYVPQTTQPTFYFAPPNINQVRQQCSSSFTNFPPPSYPIPPPNFGYMSMGPAVLRMQPYNAQFGHPMPPFPPNTQPFVPSTFGPPNIPPLPGVPHVLPQPPPPGGYPVTLPVIPPPIMNVPKPPMTKIVKPLKSNPNGGGVVPKTQPARSSKVYVPSSSEYQPLYPPNLGLPKAPIPPFNSNPPLTMATTIPPNFCPPMPPWAFNVARPQHSSRGFQPHFNARSRPFQKQ